MTDEEFCDAEIAPLLMRAGELAQGRGLALIAAVEYAPGEFARTVTLPVGHSFAMAMSLMAVHAQGNVDALFFGIVKRVRHDGAGHSSMILAQMGVPTAPATLDEDTPK